MAEDNKKEKERADKEKSFEAALDQYGQAAKAGNVSLMEKNRVALLGFAGLTGKQTAANAPKS